MDAKFETTLGYGERVYAIPRRKGVSVEDVVQIDVDSEIATDIKITYPADRFEIVTSRSIEMPLKKYLQQTENSRASN